MPYKHAHTQTNTQVLVSEWHGSTWCGVSLGSSISTPRKTSMALFDPPLKVCLKRAMDGWRDGGDTPHQWAWPAASGTFSPHSYHPIKYGTQKQRRRDWEQAQGEVGGQHSIPLKSRADEETYTNTTHTHIADKQVRGKKVFKWSFAFTVLNKLPNHCAGGMLHCASVPRKQV